MSRQVFTKMPPWAWSTIEKTIRMDAESGAFDPDLRRALWDAVGSVAVIKVKGDWAVAMPKEAWDLIQDTLTIDMHSSWYDKNVRKEIRKAMAKAEFGDLIGPKDWVPGRK